MHEPAKILDQSTYVLDPNAPIMFCEPYENNLCWSSTGHEVTQEDELQIPRMRMSRPIPSELQCHLSNKYYEKYPEAFIDPSLRGRYYAQEVIKPSRTMYHPPAYMANDYFSYMKHLNERNDPDI
jgi:hypothetical protein